MRKSVVFTTKLKFLQIGTDDQKCCSQKNQVSEERRIFFQSAARAEPVDAPEAKEHTDDKICDIQNQRMESQDSRVPIK